MTESIAFGYQVLAQLAIERAIATKRKIDLRKEAREDNGVYRTRGFRRNGGKARLRPRTIVKT